MHFNLIDLRLFILIAEEGSLTRAASRLHLSLAATSERIKSLEAQAKLRLLYRESRGVRLTPAGEAFAHHARILLQQVERLTSDLQAYGSGATGQVRVFANTTAVTDFLPEVLARFLSEHPRVSVDLHEKSNAEIIRGVIDGSTDIGIVAGNVEVTGLDRIHFSTDRLVLVTPGRHRFARRRRVSFAQTFDDPHVGMHAGSTIHGFLQRIVEGMGRSLPLRIQVRGFDAMCRMIEAGVGIGIVPESAARRHARTMDIALVELADDWAVRERHLLVRDEASLPVHARKLIDALRAEYAEQIGKTEAGDDAAGAAQAVRAGEGEAGRVDRSAPAPMPRARPAGRRARDARAADEAHLTMQKAASLLPSRSRK